MHGSDTEHAAAEGHDAVLSQTSALRLAAEVLAADPRDERCLADIARAGRALNGALRRPGLEVLLDGGDVLEKMALLGRTLSGDDSEAAAAVFLGLTSAVGILEQSLDAVLFGAAGEQLEGYGDAMIAAFPERWRPYIEPPDDEERSDVPATEARPTDAAPDLAETPVETTFLVEVLDRLAVCEEAALDWQGPDDVRSCLESIDVQLGTIEEAFTALGIDARTLAEARRLLAGVRAGEDELAPGALAEALLEVVDWARWQTARACDLPAFATDVVPDPRPDRLRTSCSAAGGDEADVRRLLRSLRRPLRDAALARGCWVDLDTSSPALRLDRLVADRVRRALSFLLRSGFDERLAEPARAAVRRVFRVRVESWEPTSLVVVVDETDATRRGDDAANENDEAEGRPEALHGFDVTRDPKPEDWERLTYRQGFSNVVVMVVPEGSLGAVESPP